MTPEERAGFLAHARLPVFRRRVQRAKDDIVSMLALTESPYVAFSLGKDSAVLLDLVAGVRGSISARTLTSGETRLLHRNWDSILEFWLARFPALDYLEVLIDRVFDPAWTDADWVTQRKAGKRDIRDALPGSGQFDGVFLGLRDEESKGRRFANKRGRIRQYSPDRKDGCADLWCCCPLAQWTTRDVGTYHVLHGLPTLQAYEEEGFETRTAARLTGDSVRQMSFQGLRMRDPDGYNRLLQRFPELAAWNG